MAVMVILVVCSGVLTVLAAGCQSLRELAVPSAKATAESIRWYCLEMKNDPAGREEFIQLVNGYYEDSNLIALDCDGDGVSDELLARESPWLRGRDTPP